MITIRKPANESEVDWLEDSDRFFNEDWEEEMSVVVPDSSHETHLIADVDGELCSIHIIGPGWDAGFADKVAAAILEACAGKIEAREEAKEAEKTTK